VTENRPRIIVLMSVTDLFGHPVERKTTVAAFHDEREVPGWLYHGFVLLERSGWTAFADHMRRARERASCTKPVHFVDLKGSSHGSSRTRLALNWAKAIDGDLLPLIRFFLLGIDLRKIDNRFFGDEGSTRAEKTTRRYNRFFEMGLYGALRWFFPDHDEVEVSRIFAERRSLPANDPFLQHSPYKINLRESNIRVSATEVTMLEAKREPSGFPPGIFDAIQLADVLVGGSSLLLDATGSQDGCREVANCLLPRVRKMNEVPFNTNSRAWKRLAMRFFPKQSAAKQIKTYDQAWGETYETRELTYLSKDQALLFESTRGGGPRDRPRHR